MRIDRGNRQIRKLCGISWSRLTRIRRLSICACLNSFPFIITVCWQCTVRCCVVLYRGERIEVRMTLKTIWRSYPFFFLVDGLARSPLTVISSGLVPPITPKWLHKSTRWTRCPLFLRLCLTQPSAWKHEKTKNQTRETEGFCKFEFRRFISFDW